MAEKWLNEKLLSLDELVRVEQGPQIVELDVTAENLSDEKTAPHYQVGRIDALGNRIPQPGNGAKMHVADWRAKIAPHLWKIYVFSEQEETDAAGNVQMVARWRKVNEIEDKDAAVAEARRLHGEMA